MSRAGHGPSQHRLCKSGCEKESDTRGMRLCLEAVDTGVKDSLLAANVSLQLVHGQLEEAAYLSATLDSIRSYRRSHSSLICVLARRSSFHKAAPY